MTRNTEAFYLQNAIKKGFVAEGSLGVTVHEADWIANDTVTRIALKIAPFNKNPALQKIIDKEYAFAQEFINSPAHANILPCLGIDKDEYQYYYAFPLMYSTLYEYMQMQKEQGETISWDQKYVWMRKIVRAIQALHSRDVIHRDIKGSNVLVDKSGTQVKLCDFGTAKALTTKTLTTTVFSTPHYQAPEISVPILKGQFTGSKVENKEWTKAADIFSFGMLLYEIAMEEYPFAEFEDVNVVRAKIKNKERPAISNDCNAQFKHIIEWCWQHEAEKRPTIQQLVQCVNELFFEFEFVSPWSLAELLQMKEFDDCYIISKQEKDIQTMERLILIKHEPALLDINCYKLSGSTFATVAEWYYTGDGVEQSFEKSIKLFQKAITLGFQDVSKVASLFSCIGDRQLSSIDWLQHCEFLMQSDVHLYNNQIVDISALRNLKTLTKLDLCNNQIANISGLSGLTELTWLKLGNNQVADISALCKLKALTTLYLYNNKIVDISSLSELKSLTELDLYNNQIVDISALGKLVMLTTLKLCYNQIMDISALGKMNALKELDLYENQIVDVSALGNLPGLKWLKLGNNQVSNTASIRHLENFANFYL